MSEIYHWCRVCHCSHAEGTMCPETNRLVEPSAEGFKAGDLFVSTAPVSNSRSVLLDEAGALIDGQRASDYGDAAENFTRIATGWAEILGTKVTPAQVALCMDWLKTCRLITSPTHRDSWIDKLGYSALGGEVAL